MGECETKTEGVIYFYMETNITLYFSYLENWIYLISLIFWLFQGSSIDAKNTSWPFFYIFL